MQKSRLEAFSDGVLAIIITIMVLEFKVPKGETWPDLLAVAPTFISYLLSFVYIGIYWSNHHHLFQAVRHVGGRVLWANLHLLFWLSLLPFVTTWAGESEFAELPVRLYGLVLLMAGSAYYFLVRVLISNRANSVLAEAVGRDFKGFVSPIIYAVAIGLSFWFPRAAAFLYLIVAVMWIIPDRRIERLVNLP